MFTHDLSLQAECAYHRHPSTYVCELRSTALTTAFDPDTRVIRHTTVQVCNNFPKNATDTSKFQAPER